ncbi:hypothetical protein PENTCL1PPCAC_24503, partial [Pristionchus entomophagus]
MILRLLSIVAFLHMTSAVDNPCKGKKTTGCKDIGASCAAIFRGVDGILPSCYDSSQPDFLFTPNCRETCQLCCEDPQFNCDNDTEYKTGCAETQTECNMFNNINYQHCQSSCGWCDKKSPPCLDNLTPLACSNYKAANLCSTDEVKNNCLKTCDVCVGCDDASTRCKIWKDNGFFDDPFYKPDTTAMFCEKTCGIC